LKSKLNKIDFKWIEFFYKIKLK